MKQALFLIFFSVLTSSFSPRPEEEILLTDDYGIVIREDIEREKARITEECWTFREYCPTHYWQCLELNDVAMRCEPAGELETHERAYSPILQIRNGDTIFDFSTRRPWDLTTCINDLKAWTDLFEGENIACFGAIYVGVEAGPGSQLTEGWLVDFVKSRKGKWSYWKDD